MLYAEHETGTLLGWDPGVPIIYPQVVRPLDGKPRGGAHLCLPIFGSQPEGDGAGPYNGCAIPQHGFARRGVYRLVATSRSEQWFDGKYRWESSPEYPWAHQAFVTMECPKPTELVHSILVVRAFSCKEARSMPLSAGFHPYFQTENEAFEISYSTRRVKSEKLTPNQPFFWRLIAGRNPVVRIRLSHGVVEMHLIHGYESVCIWTDDAAQYICVEPVLGKPDGCHLLQIGEGRTMVCKMVYIPSR